MNVNDAFLFRDWIAAACDFATKKKFRDEKMYDEKLLAVVVTTEL